MAAHVLSSFSFKLYLNDGIFTTSYYRINKNKAHNYYDILGVKNTASLDEIKLAYKKQSIIWHPDYYRQESDGKRIKCDLRFIALSNAFNHLNNSVERKIYDDKAVEFYDIPHIAQISCREAYHIFVEHVFASMKIRLSKHDSIISLFKYMSLPPVFEFFGGTNGFVVGTAFVLLINGDEVSNVLHHLSDEQRDIVYTLTKILMQKDNL